MMQGGPLKNKEWAALGQMYRRLALLIAATESNDLLHPFDFPLMWLPIIRHFEQHLMDGWTSRLGRIKRMHSMEESERSRFSKYLCKYLKEQAERIDRGRGRSSLCSDEGSNTLYKSCIRREESGRALPGSSQQQFSMTLTRFPKQLRR